MYSQFTTKHTHIQKGFEILPTTLSLCAVCCVLYPQFHNSTIPHQKSMNSSGVVATAVLLSLVLLSGRGGVLVLGHDRSKIPISSTGTLLQQSKIINNDDIINNNNNNINNKAGLLTALKQKRNPFATLVSHHHRSAASESESSSTTTTVWQSLLQKTKWGGRTSSWKTTRSNNNNNNSNKNNQNKLPLLSPREDTFDTNSDNENDDDGEDDEQEREENEWNNNGSHGFLATTPLLARAVDSILKDRQKITIWSLKAVQYTLIWFLLKSIWKALKETVDELSQESSLMGGDPYFCSSSDLGRLLNVMEQQISTGNGNSNSRDPNVNDNNNSNINNINNNINIKGTGLLPRGLLQLAHDLYNAGLSLRSHPSSSGMSSIESLFTDMTRTEASILQQCLWRPPAWVRKNPDELWNAVIGLDAVKENILLTVAAASPPPPPAAAAAASGTASSGNHGPYLEHLHKTQQAYASLLSSSTTSESSSSTSTTSQHFGMLLYGEPGCGKSLFVQALASKLQLPCLVVTPSVLMRKYVGDTNLQVRSLFSLVQNKLFPCIVVLDELDGLFRERHENEHDASRELKTEFLQWLSGIMTTSSKSSASSAQATPRHPLIVIGATNRPLDVDSAILRRLPQRFYVGLPDFYTRCQLIEQMLKDVPLSDEFQTHVIGQMTEGYTPSDLRQVLQTAARVGPIKDAIMAGQGPHASSNNLTVRPLSMQDVQDALSRVSATPLSPNYRSALQQFTSSAGTNGHYPTTQQDEFSHGNVHGTPSSGLHFMNIGTVQSSLDNSSPWGSPSEKESKDGDYSDDDNDINGDDEEDIIDSDEDEL